MKASELPIDLQKKIGILDVDGMQRIQYYPADLAYALGLQGEIADMHVDIENGIQILRMTVIPLPDDQYKTIRAAPKEKTRTTVQKRQPKPKVKPKKTVGDVVTAKVKDGVKNWWNRKDKPQFMKDAGY